MNCDKEAVALLTFAPTEAKAWLYDLDGPDPTHGIMLCRRHANATVVPMSWQLIDARDPAWPGPVGSQSPTQAMAAASAEEMVPVPTAQQAMAPAVPSVNLPSTSLPSDASSIDREFAGLQRDLPVATQPYAEPRLATARAAGRSVSSDLIVDHVEPAHEASDQSLFDLPISDIPAVTPHPRY